MTEDYLHYIWKTGYFERKGLCTTEGQKVKILFSGYPNSDSGPDFSEARIQIGREKWIGPVEIHVRSSEWKRHGHHRDTAYKNVILHVVYENDTEIRYPSGEIIPALELKGRMEEYTYWRFEQLVQGQRVIPCQNQLPGVDKQFIRLQYDQWAVQRIKQKSERLKSIYVDCHLDWQETFYRFFFYGIGLSVNAESFYTLSGYIPFKIISRHRGNRLQTEALLFGVAGLLESSEEKYPRQLFEEYQFLKEKYGLREMEAHQWKFARMRPAGFPTIRLAQLAGIVHHSGLYFREFVNMEPGQFGDRFKSEPSDYWLTHYRFGQKSRWVSKKPGGSLISRMYINIMVPFVFFFAETNELHGVKDELFEKLHCYAPEKNRIITLMKTMGFPVKNALEGQAVIHVYKELCSYKKCLHCAIGNKLLNF